MPTPWPPLQCVEIFHHCCSNEKNIIARLLKFAGYIYHQKSFSRDIFGLIFKNKIATITISLLKNVLCRLLCDVGCVITPQPLRADEVFFSPMVAGWAGGQV